MLNGGGLGRASFWKLVGLNELAALFAFLFRGNDGRQLTVFDDDQASRQTASSEERLAVLDRRSGLEAAGLTS